MKIYLKIDNQSIIRDAITYQYKGYTEVEIAESQLPVGLSAGYYKWNGTSFEVDSILKEEVGKNSNDKTEQLKLEVESLKKSIAELTLLISTPAV